MLSTVELKSCTYGWNLCVDLRVHVHTDVCIDKYTDRCVDADVPSRPIVLAYIVMAYVVMAYVVMVYVVMAQSTTRGRRLTRYIVMAYVVMAYVLMTYAVMVQWSGNRSVDSYGPV